jgi:hypothetical protein
LWVYANELAQTVDTDDERSAAVRRLLEHYVHTALAAALMLDPRLEPFTLDAPVPGVTTESPIDRRQALVWMTAEQDALAATIERASRTGMHSQVWLLCTALASFLRHRGHWAKATTVVRTTQSLAWSLTDPRERARFHGLVGFASVKTGLLEEAHLHLQAADQTENLSEDHESHGAHHHGLILPARRCAWSGPQR